MSQQVIRKKENCIEIQTAIKKSSIEQFPMEMCTEWILKVLPRFELGLTDSESEVLTITP